VGGGGGGEGGVGEGVNVAWVGGGDGEGRAGGGGGWGLGVGGGGKGGGGGVSELTESKRSWYTKRETRTNDNSTQHRREEKNGVGNPGCGGGKKGYKKQNKKKKNCGCSRGRPGRTRLLLKGAKKWRKRKHLERAPADQL